MQEYFDRDDAELEHQSILANALSHTDAENETRADNLGRRKYLNLLGLSAGLVVLAMILVFHLSSTEPLQSQSMQEPDPVETRFIIEIPEPEPQKPKPKPKPVIKQPEPEPAERMRSVPDQKTQKIRPQEKLRERNEKQETDRDALQESTVKRTLPAVKTPKIAMNESVNQRDDVKESIRQSTISDRSESRGAYVPEGKVGEHRSVPETGLSRIQLDPYHYQMVNVCLRLCVRTMFTHSGIDANERNNSSAWLRINREGTNYFEFRHGGSWVRFHVKVSSLGDISNIDFVTVPNDWSSGDGAQTLLEDTTRKLCRLLGYDDCLQKL